MKEGIFNDNSRATFLYSFVFVALITILFLGLSINMIPVAMFSALIIIGACVLLGTLLYFTERNDGSKTYQWFYYSILLTVFAMFLTVVVSGWQMSLTEKKGDRVIAAIENYKQKYGELPKALEELVSTNEVEELPSSFVGLKSGDFKYVKMDDKFRLEYHAAFGMNSFYTPDQGWDSEE